MGEWLGAREGEQEQKQRSLRVCGRRGNQLGEVFRGEGLEKVNNWRKDLGGNENGMEHPGCGMPGIGKYNVHSIGMLAIQEQYKGEVQSTLPQPCEG